MNTFPKIIVAFFATAILSTAGCGGGGGGGDTPPPTTPPPTTPPPTGGITGTGVAVGPITGFGSVIVNGVTYDTTEATDSRKTVCLQRRTIFPSGRSCWSRAPSMTMATLPLTALNSMMSWKGRFRATTRPPVNS